MHDVYEFKQDDLRTGKGLKKGRVQGSSRLDAGTSSSSRYHEDDDASRPTRGGGESDDEDDDNEAAGGLNGKSRPRLIGENQDDEMIDSDDDEEIDSDAAFEEEDDTQWGGVFNRHQQQVRNVTRMLCSISVLLITNYLIAGILEAD